MNQQPSLPPETPSLARTAATIYGAMTLLGLGLMYFWQNNLGAAFALPDMVPDRWRMLAAGATGAAFLLITGALVEQWSESFRQLKKMFRELVGPASWWVAIWLAVVSSIGEETLFRGALQPSLGILPTSILFGLAHLGPDGKPGVWSAWACLAGIVLGWTFAETGCLWPAIVAHFLVNAISLLSLQRQYRQR